MTDDELTELLMLRQDQLRESAKHSLNAFCRYIEIPGAPINESDDCDEFYPDKVIPAKHHEKLNEALQRIANKESKRLMVFMPPGSAKSTYASVVFPTWFMGRSQGKNIISTSYGSELAKKFGRRCRQIAGSKEYVEVFDAALNSDHKAVDNWSISNQSTYMSGGILSGITGNRADGLVIDDPVKGREDAESSTMREKTWEAYLSDLLTRLKPGGWIVIIQTRWHADDLSGRILPDTYAGESGTVIAKDGEPWEVLCLQAQCGRDDDPLEREVGEYLWTDWFTIEHWQQVKKTQGSKNWSSLYQQSPKMEEGGIVEQGWFRYFKTNPQGIKTVQSWDTAQKEKELNDFTVCTTWIMTSSAYFLIDLYKERMNYPKLKRAILSKATEFAPDAILIEDKGSGTSVIQSLREETALPVIAIEPTGSKEFRLSAVSPLFEAGAVFFKEDAAWRIDLESEITTFPNVPHDDQVDSVSQFLNWTKKPSEIFIG